MFSLCRIAVLNDTKLVQRLQDSIERTKSVVSRNAVTAVREPDVYPGQDMSDQFLAVLKDDGSHEFDRDLGDFFDAVLVGLLEDGDGADQDLVRRMLDDVAVELRDVPLVLVSPHQTRVLEYFADSPSAAVTFVMYNFPCNPADAASGKFFGDTLLGVYKDTCSSMVCILKVVRAQLLIVDVLFRQSSLQVMPSENRDYYAGVL
jgi:hypothetical protein